MGLALGVTLLHPEKAPVLVPPSLVCVGISLFYPLVLQATYAWPVWTWCDLGIVAVSWSCEALRLTLFNLHHSLLYQLSSFHRGGE